MLILTIITELDDINESVIFPQQSFWLRSLVQLIAKEAKKVPVAITHRCFTNGAHVVYLSTRER